MKKKHFKSVFIAGFAFYEGAEVFNKLEVGTTLDLKVEQDNRYDEYAVALYYKKHKLGYIPKGFNEEISKVISAGYNIFTGIIQQLDSRENPQEQVRVGIYTIIK